MTTDANNPGVGAESNPQADANTELATDATELETEAVGTEGEDAQTETDDTDEIEHDGVKHRIPKALKSAFLMQADYTRKTQEVAEQRNALEEQGASLQQQRNALEEQGASLQQQAAAREAHFRIAGRVSALEDALSQFENVDWASLCLSNREQYELTRIQEQQLRAAHAKASRELSEKVTEAQRASEAETATRKTKLAESLARDIPGYSPELATKMQTFGVATYGFSAAEIAGTTDPRLHRLLNDARIGRELQEKAAKAAAAAKTAAAAQGASPPAQVGSRAQSAKISASAPSSDKLSSSEWKRRREEEIRRQNA